jgi:hypothetical protein
MTGGGLGIYGDFILQDHNIFGQALPDALKLTVGNVEQLLSGDDTEIMREAAEIANRVHDRN